MVNQPIKLTRGVPPPESFPVEQLAECSVAALRTYSDAILQYGPAGGFLPLRQYLAQLHGVAEYRVVVGQGSLQLQDLCARMMITPGAITYVEEPTYDRTLTILRRAGALVIGFPLDGDGPDVDAIEERLKDEGERPLLFYIIPDFQNPSGTVLSLKKRERIAALAQEYGFWIMEDVPYRRLRYRGSEPPTLYSLAPDRVFLMSSYSKLISPGLRVGYMIMPETIARPLLKFIEDTYITPGYLAQAIVYEYIQRGWLEPNIETLKALYEPRLDAMLSALDEQLAGLATWRRPDGGFFVGMTLQAEVRAKVLLAQAKAAGLQLTDGRGFFASGGGDRFVRLPFCALTPEEIREGIQRLADVVRALA